MSSTRSAFWRGLLASLPFIVMAAPFGILFGVVATEAGFDLSQSFAMSIIVVAGASQLTALQVLSDGSPFYIAVITGLAVNMRMAMYSASLAPHLGEAKKWQRIVLAYFMIDQTYGVSIMEYERNPALSISDKLSYFFGSATVIFPVWYISTLVGVFAGSAIPPEYALDFAVPIMFIALVAPSLRSLPHIVAALVSICVSLSLAWLPYNLWLMIAAVFAMIAGAEVERRIEARS